MLFFSLEEIINTPQTTVDLLMAHSDYSPTVEKHQQLKKGPRC